MLNRVYMKISQRNSGRTKASISPSAVDVGPVRIIRPFKHLAQTLESK